MAGGIFDPKFGQLPMRIPIFPLPSALLLPGGQLPLNVFEPRYLAMVMHALATPTRLIGMVQPLDHHAGDYRANDDMAGDPALFETGCAGRLSFFQESDDGRFVIALNGVCRSMICPFEVAEKQALLEADSMAKRANLLIAMMEMALYDESGGNDARH